MRTFYIRPYFKNQKLKIDGRTIPYPLVTAEEYIKAVHEDMTDEEYNRIANDKDTQKLNQVLALKQALYLMEHTQYSSPTLTQALEGMIEDTVREYNRQKPYEPYDDLFYESYKFQVVKIVNSLSEIDMGEFENPVFTIYRKPLDFPDSYVIRVRDIIDGQVYVSNLTVLHETLNECRNDILGTGHTYCVPRDKTDDKAIVESWL